MQFITN